MSDKRFPGWFKSISRRKIHWFVDTVVFCTIYSPCGLLIDLFSRKHFNIRGPHRFRNRIKDPHIDEVCKHCLKAMMKHPFYKIAINHPARSRVKDNAQDEPYTRHKAYLTVV